MEIEAWIAELGSTDVAMRRAAAEALSRNGAADAVVPLVLACGDSDEQVQELASAALEDLGPPPKNVAADLAAQLERGGLPSYWAATLLGRLEEEAAPWASALGNATQIKHDQSVRQRAAWALGKIGPGAAIAIPALEAAKHDGDARLVRLATEALQRIGATS